MQHNEKLDTIDQRAAEQPIYLPDHPYIAKLKDLGVDEIIAAFVDPISTTLMGGILSGNARAIVLPITGPLTEKFTFFIRHGLEARKIYNTTPERNRKEYNFYLKQGLKHGASNLGKDLLYHDPMYITLMAAGMKMFPDVPPGVISFASYAISVLGAVGLDVGLDELKHSINKKRMKNSGFFSENYYESRFYVLSEKNPQDILEELVKEFGLEYQGTVKYHDKYFDVNHQGYSGREVKMRLRSRDKREFEKSKPEWNKNHTHANGEQFNTLQIIYNRAYEHRKGVDQCRYFPVKKEKMYAFVDSDISSLEEITDPKISKIGKKLQIDKNRTQIVTFDRTIARNEKLAVCTDGINSKRPFYVLELKVYDDTRLLQQAMRYLMVECPLAATQTTYGKSDIII
ncbi:MAG: hypothetical protein ACP5OA_01420 [Candidatus Woesearchaeota archaeon]